MLSGLIKALTFRQSGVALAASYTLCYYHMISMKVYIDESGSLGQKDRYFVIAALAPHSESAEKRIKNIIRRAHANHCLPLGYAELKASKLSFPAKQKIINLISSSDQHSI
ncbi:MAG: DUF3800 domain-containing protein [Candidatus Dojkabacteria bacterium]